MSENAGSIGVDVVPDARGFDEKLRAQIRDITVSVRAKVDDELAKSDLDALARDRGLKLVPKVDDPAAAKARAEMTRLRVLARDAGLTIKPKVSPEDAAKADLELRELARNRNVELEPKVKKEAAAEAGRDLSLLTTSVLTLGPALIPIAAATGGLAVALGAPLTAAGGGLTLFGFLAGREIKETDKVAKQIDALTAKAAALTNPKAKAAAQAQIVALEQSLSGPQRKFLELRAQLKDTVDKASSNKTFFTPINAGLSLMNTVLPKTRPLLNAVSTSLGGLLTDLTRFAQSKSFDHVISGMAALASPTIRLGGEALGNIGKGLAGLGQAFGPLGLHMLVGIKDLTAGFATFGQGSSTNASVQAFITYLRTEGPRVAQTLGDVATAAVHVATALAPIGGVVLHGIDLLAKTISAMPTGDLTVLATGIVAVRLALQGISLYTKAGTGLDSIGAQLGKLGRSGEALSRTQVAIRGLAGSAGIGLLVDSTQRASHGMGLLEAAGGGALTGASLGAFAGPEGAAIGAAIGGLAAGALTLFHNTQSAGNAASGAIGKWQDYAATLDQVTGATTEATRATALRKAADAGILKTTRAAGIADREVVNAIVNGGRARDRVIAGIKAEVTAVDSSIAAKKRDLAANIAIANDMSVPLAQQTAAANRVKADRDQIDALNTLRATRKKDADEVLAGLGAVQKGIEETQKNAAAVRDLTGKLKGIPPAKRLAIKSEGIIPTTKGITTLAEKYRLTPKQIKTVIAASGVQMTQGQVQTLIDRVKAYGILHPKPRLDADTSAASAKIWALIDAIAHLRDKTVHITTMTNANVAETVGTRPPKHRAMGGPVYTNESYIVGDRGPRSAWELFTPSVDGFIHPHVPTAETTARSSIDLEQATYRAMGRALADNHTVIMSKDNLTALDLLVGTA